MSWLFSQALVEQYSAGTSLDGEPSSQLNVMPTPHKFWRNDKMMEPSRLSQFGLTCRLLTADHGAELLTSYLAASHVRTLAQLGRAPALTASAAGSGHSSSGLFAMFNPAASTWKTVQCSLLEDSESYSETWPRWGSMRNGASYLRPMPVLRICESASGLWPTPNACKASNDMNLQCSGDGRERPNKLGWAVAAAESKRWTTPSATDSRRGGTITDAMTGSSLAQQVNTPALWPTPTASLGTKGGRITPRKGREGGTLIEAVSARTWPTPCTSASKGSSPAALTRKAGKSRANDRIDHAVMASDGGQLNPEWVEWLMGWPIGWTELKPLEMDKFHEWQQQHGGF